MQAHAEHQQDHAELGELRRQFAVGHEAGCERPHHYAGQQVSHQRRHAEAIGYRPEDECKHKTRNDRGDQGGVVMHWASCGA